MFRLTWKSSAVLAAGLLAGAAHAQTVRNNVVTVARAGMSFIGVGIQEIDAERAKNLKLREEGGVEITRVDEGSPAEKAGLKSGDVVLQYNGVKVEGIEQFSRMVRETPAGRAVKVDIARNGAVQSLMVTVGARPAPGVYVGGTPLPEIRVPDMPRVAVNWRSGVLGVEAEPLEGQLAQYFGVKEGVLVRSVIKDSAAEKAGLKAGDVIVKVDDKSVNSLSDISARIRAQRGKIVAITVTREHREMTMNVPIDDERPAPVRANHLVEPDVAWSH